MGNKSSKLWSSKEYSSVQPCRIGMDLPDPQKNVDGFDFSRFGSDAPMHFQAGWLDPGNGSMSMENHLITLTLGAMKDVDAKCIRNLYCMRKLVFMK